ncbi:hypothetical protein [Brachybacterium sacelli]
MRKLASWMTQKWPVSIISKAGIVSTRVLTIARYSTRLRRSGRRADR